MWDGESDTDDKYVKFFSTDPKHGGECDILSLRLAIPISGVKTFRCCCKCGLVAESSEMSGKEFLAYLNDGLHGWALVKNKIAKMQEVVNRVSNNADNLRKYGPDCKSHPEVKKVMEELRFDVDASGWLSMWGRCYFSEDGIPFCPDKVFPFWIGAFYEAAKNNLKDPK